MNCEKCGKEIPNGQLFHSEKKYDENHEPIGFTNELCLECAKKENKEINSIV